ncbi:MAG: VOC family protein [Pseudomonadota bacterium]
MGDYFMAAAGATVSGDIAVPEHAREHEFYVSVLTTGDDPRWRDDLTNNDGTPIIGLGERTEMYESLPLQWFPHIQVSDIAKSVERALELGGKELMHGKDDDGNSLWACVADPTGNAFGLIPVVTSEQLPPHEAGAPAPGRIAWMDLTVDDAESVSAFYESVIGWKADAAPMTADGEQYSDYNMCVEGNTPAAGVCHARGVNTEIPPVWMLYLPVGDLAESLRRVEAGGGDVIKAAKNDDGTLAYAVVKDPLGVSFGLVPA